LSPPALSSIKALWLNDKEDVGTMVKQLEADGFKVTRAC
jgi:hypothetical protein